MILSDSNYVYLHVGCEWSEEWDRVLIKQLTDLHIEFEICDLNTVKIHRPGIFIGRFSEKCTKYKKGYGAKTAKFERCWPEPSVFELYDDKCAQAVWLQKHGHPQPDFEIVTDDNFYWHRYPVMHKKSFGSSSKYVKLINDRHEVEPPCLLQEFCANNNGDYRVTVIGNQVTTVGRLNRLGDVRASGGGRPYICDTDPYVAELCWKICRSNGWATMGFDILKNNEKWVIIEMSYTWPIYSVSQLTETIRKMPENVQMKRTEHPVQTLLNYILNDY